MISRRLSIPVELQVCTHLSYQNICNDIDTNRDFFLACSGRPKGVMLTHGNLLHQIQLRFAPTKKYDVSEPLPGEVMYVLINSLQASLQTR
jgi:hypothetical protein